MPEASPLNKQIIIEARSAYRGGRNVMGVLRSLGKFLPRRGNSLTATLLSYDLQAGSYVELAKEMPEDNLKWSQQVCRELSKYFNGGEILEVGVGEATTLAGVVKGLRSTPGRVMGFDVSWSRLNVAREWLGESGVKAELFVADLVSIPLETDSVELVYSSHSLEPNRGLEQELIKEMLRVARKFVILIEPLYEFADRNARKRMKTNGYVRGLRKTAEKLGATVLEHRLLDFYANPLNPSGILVLAASSAESSAAEVDAVPRSTRGWQCPVTGSTVFEGRDYFSVPGAGIVYPVLRGIPMLRPEHAIVASGISER